MLLVQSARIYFFSVFVILFSCQNNIADVNKIAKEKKKFPTATYLNYDVLYSDSAIVRIRMQGKIMEQYDQDIAHDDFKEGVHIEFYDLNKKVESEVTANRAVRERTANTMQAYGNVIVFNRKGDRLNTEHLVWDSNTKRIYTNEHVRITTSDKIIIGKGLESDETFTNYKVKNITGQIRLK